SIRKFRLWVLVQVLHVGVRWRAVHVEVVFLHILPVVPFTVRQPKEALFKNGISSIPESNSKTELLLIVGNPGDAIFAPAVSAGARRVVTEVVPRVPVLTVVLADRSPLTLT